jgi:hypothetical protein
MDKRHLKSLYALLLLLAKARKRPLQNGEKWKSLQLAVLKKVLQIERRIRRSRTTITELKRNLSTPGKISTKDEAATFKRSIAKKEDQIQGLQRLLLAFRCVVDAIAFTFIDKYDINPLYLKKRPASLAGRKASGSNRKYFGIVTRKARSRF